jgi:chromosome partitioning protein
MGHVITFGLQKGGVAKSSSCGITAYLLAQKGYRILLADMDSQGNLTEMMTQRDIYDFSEATILEAIKERNAKKFLHPCLKNIDILTATDTLATLAHYIHTSKSDLTVLRETLKTVKDQYDFILIDTPPALGEQTLSSLAASDFVVIMYEPAQFAHSALDRFVETVEFVKEKINPKLEIAGILSTMVDHRKFHTKTLIRLVKKIHPNMMFNTQIKRRVAIERLPLVGFEENEELDVAVDQYKTFVEELIKRVSKKTVK